MIVDRAYLLGRDELGVSRSGRERVALAAITFMWRVTTS